MPWSAFAFKAVARAIPLRSARLERTTSYSHPHLSGTHSTDAHALGRLPSALLQAAPRGRSTPSFPHCPPPPSSSLTGSRKRAVSNGSPSRSRAKKLRRANLRSTAVLFALSSIFATALLVFLLHTRAPVPSTDLCKSPAPEPRRLRALLRPLPRPQRGCPRTLPVPARAGRRRALPGPAVFVHPA